MRTGKSGWGAVAGAVAMAIGFALVSATAAQAHHAMGGGTPETLMQGLLSGFGHPIIGLDHLAFIVAMGVAVGVAGLSLVVPALFIVASAVGVAVHVQGLSLPVVEAVVATSVLVAGATLASGRALGVAGWSALFAVAGLFHGHAFGEAVVGAEPTPLVAYLVGLVIVQTALATAVALVARRSGSDAVSPRLAGATIAGIGIAILVGQAFPG